MGFKENKSTEFQCRKESIIIKMGDFNMETTNFSSKSSLIDNLLEVFDNNNDITLVVDKEIADIFLDEYDDETEFDYYAISVASDTNEYFISKVEDIHFSIEEAKYRGEYKYDDASKVIILDELYDREILDYIQTKDIEIYGVEKDSIYNDLDFRPDSNDECTCCGDCCNCYYDEHDEVDLSEFEKLNDAQKDYLFTELSDMEDINLNKLAKICMVFYDDGVNSTLLKAREILATLEK